MAGWCAGGRDSSQSGGLVRMRGCSLSPHVEHHQLASLPMVAGTLIFSPPVTTNNTVQDCLTAHPYPVLAGSYGVESRGVGWPSKPYRFPDWNTVQKNASNRPSRTTGVRWPP